MTVVNNANLHAFIKRKIAVYLLNVHNKSFDFFKDLHIDNA